ncbi:MAG: hypothetical protein JWO45_711 [Spartobacteria bacterium]|nr:hypothetical protein [Spartobacteria bacterium]
MKISRKFGLCSGLCIALLVLLAYFYFGPVNVPTADPVPNPNGYDDFVAAQNLVVASMTLPALPGERDFEMEAARRHFASNTPAIERLRLGLAKQSAVPIVYTNDWISTHVNEMAGMKRLARNLALGGALEKIDGRMANALEYDVDILRLATAINHGGLLIDNLVAAANENIAFAELEKLEPGLDASQCRMALGELERWRTNREPFAITLEREKRWGNLYGRLQHTRVEYMLLRIVSIIPIKSLNPLAAAYDRAQSKQNQVFRRAAKLQVVLAAHVYKADHKAAPIRWGDLVPSYLPAVPLDPDTDRELAFPF